MKNTNNILFIVILINFMFCKFGYSQYSQEERQAILDAKKKGNYNQIVDSLNSQNTLPIIDYGFYYSRKESVLQKVIEIKGSKNELYLKAKKGIIERNNNPDFSIVADVENEVLKYKSRVTPFHYKGSFISTRYDLEYIVTIEFKKDKVRLTYDFLIPTYVTGDFIRTVNIEDFKYYVWKGNGRYRNSMDEFVTKLDNFLNGHATYLITSINKKDDW